MHMTSLLMTSHEGGYIIKHQGDQLHHLSLWFMNLLIYLRMAGHCKRQGVKPGHVQLTCVIPKVDSLIDIRHQPVPRASALHLLLIK